MENDTLDWGVADDLRQSPEYRANNRLALETSKLGRDEVISRYTYVSPEQILDVLRLDSVVWNSFAGVGIDLGGGVGCVSAAVACSPAVEKIYCLELVENAVRVCQPMIFNELGLDERQKIVSVVGNFNHLALGNQVLDFAVMWDSFHHSADPSTTLGEIRRVLKPGGQLIMIDRAHNNAVSDKQVEDWLEHEYDESFKRANFIDPSEKLTRRMNGEHEWRFREIEGFLEQAGFSIVQGIGVRFGSASENDAGYPEVYHPVDLGGFIKKKFIFVCE